MMVIRLHLKMEINILGQPKTGVGVGVGGAGPDDYELSAPLLKHKCQACPAGTHLAEQHR